MYILYFIPSMCCIISRMIVHAWCYEKVWDKSCIIRVCNTWLVQPFSPRVLNFLMLPVKKKVMSIGIHLCSKKDRTF